MSRPGDDAEEGAPPRRHYTECCTFSEGADALAKNLYRWQIITEEELLAVGVITS